MDAEEITKKIYDAYGSSSGILFGIPADYRKSVEAIVKAVLREIED